MARLRNVDIIEVYLQLQTPPPHTKGNKTKGKKSGGGSSCDGLWGCRAAGESEGGGRGRNRQDARDADIQENETCTWTVSLYRQSRLQYK